MSANLELPGDPNDTPEYQAFIESMAQHCRCKSPWPSPCDGVLAGGLCDDLGNGPADLHEEPPNEPEDE